MNTPSKNPWDQRYATEDFQYGLTPNEFLVEQAKLLAPASDVLALADGEGRNGVWLAEQGHKVLSVDGSQVGLDKATKLASDRGVEISTLCTDLNAWEWPEEKFDAIVSIYFHTAPDIREKLHAKAKQSLKSGGILILEAFNKSQLGRGTGGPPNVDWLFNEEELRADFSDMKIEFLEESETSLDEGPLHSGSAGVIRLIAYKK